MVLIGHASLNENNQTKGGQPGDQTTKEVCTRAWYANNYSVLLRHPDKNIAEKSAKECEAACLNNYIGYDQSDRNSLHIQAQKVSYDLSKITTPCSCDCSSFMTVCAIAGGVKGLEYTSNAPNTSGMVAAFTRAGYQAYTDSRYLNSDQFVRRGDILIAPGHHTVMILSDGINAYKAIFPLRGIDVSTYQKNLDYKQLKACGVQFAILKVTNKHNQADSMFETHYRGFIDAGTPIAGYHYTYATTVEAANIAAMALLRVLKGHPKITTIYLDLEDKCLQGLGERLPQIINAYQEKIEGAGIKFALYSGLSFVKPYLVPYINKLKCKNIWMARYYKGYAEMGLYEGLDDSKKPTVGGFNLLGWQYTSSGIISGYSGRLDMSIMYKDVPSKDVKYPITGYVHVSASSSLRVRSLPNTDSDIVEYLNDGTKVLIYGEQNGWYNISPRLEGKWICGDYVDL